MGRKNNRRELEWEWGKATWGRHKFTRVLALRRIDKEITKAVDEKRWKDAVKLESKYQWTKEVQDRRAAEGPSMAEQEHFARIKRAKHPGGRPPPHTSDEYVEDPVEEMIRFAQHGRSRFMTQLARNVEPPRPPKRPISPPNGDGGSNKKGFFGPRHGQAEGEQYPARHGQPCPDIRPDIIEDREAAPCPSRPCKVCRKCCFGIPSPYYDKLAVCCAFHDEVD